MNVRPNETVVRATVTNITPSSDRQGYDVDLTIIENQSTDSASDFLRPRAGDRVMVYSASLGPLSTGVTIQATLALLGGPFQQRAILRKSEPIKP